jgi:hypothetical protein
VPSGRAVRGARLSLADPARDRLDDTLGSATVDVTDDGPDDPTPLLGELVRGLEATPDACDDVLEPIGTEESTGLDQLSVMLADDVLQRP